MYPCCNKRQRRRHDDEEALLPKHDGDTDLSRKMHQKMRIYQMTRAVCEGYMPSTEQIIIYIRILMAADGFATSNTTKLSPSGRYLLHLMKQWLIHVIELLRHKNEDDQLQTLIWSLRHISVQEDAQSLIREAVRQAPQARNGVALESIRTVGGLLMGNADFRSFCAGIGKVFQQVSSDTTISLANSAEEMGQSLKPNHDAVSAMHKEEDGELRQELSDVKAAASVAGNGIVQAEQKAMESFEHSMTAKTRQDLMKRLKQTVVALKGRPDYQQSVSTIALLVRRCVNLYVKGIQDGLSGAKDCLAQDEDLDQALQMAWSILTSFGQSSAWDDIVMTTDAVTRHLRRSQEIESNMTAVITFLQDLLTKPSMYDVTDEDMTATLRSRYRDSLNPDTTLQSDFSSVLRIIKLAAHEVAEDEDIQAIWTQSLKIFNVLFNNPNVLREDLLQDLIQVFLPGLIELVHCIPIPRIEISIPGTDLLLENIIIEPGKTINNTSFLPYKFNIKAYNDFELRKAHSRETSSSMTSLVTVCVKGLSIAAKDIGYWCRSRQGLFSLADEGLVSLELDERGIDITVDIEVGKERLEEILTLRKVRVKVHHLRYKLSRSKWSILAWMLKPLLRPIMRRILESQLASAIANALHAANRELIFARERLRATRISDPQDMHTFIRAVLTRWTPAQDPDFQAMIGVRPSSGIFRGVYAPGSIVKVWEEEGRLAPVKIEGNKVDANGWRNEIFEVSAIPAT